uniref:Uncharacterized protein n=1 Tax=Oryza punctata TaxID=4537 RepID=A0A0E0KAU4_ORYPU
MLLLHVTPLGQPSRKKMARASAMDDVSCPAKSRLSKRSRICSFERRDYHLLGDLQNTTKRDGPCAMRKHGTEMIKRKGLDPDFQIGQHHC